MATLADIRAKLKEQENRQAGNSTGDNAIYPFWNIKEGETAVIRFLPDGDESNTFFWRERSMIKLPFPSVKGDNDSKPVTVQIPCMEMYGESCPILNEVRGWFKDASLEDMGRKYWKKRSYVFQGFVVDDPLGEEVPENPIRRLIIGPQIFQLIKQALMDPDMEELPTDYTNGIDFRMNKTTKGGYADYATSTWARRERALNDKEMHAIQTHGLFSLNDFLPKKPTDIEVRIMQEMFEASVDGMPYDEERFGNYFRPFGLATKTGDPAPAPAPAPKKAVTEDVSPEDVLPDEEPAPKPKASKEKPAETGSDSNANDILAMIRSRQNKD